jgi:amidase
MDNRGSIFPTRWIWNETAPATRQTSKKDQLLSRTNGIDAVLQANRLDAILAPGANGADLAARAAYPLIVVPFGMVPNSPPNVPPGGPQQRQGPYPPGFNSKPAPFGVGFTGTACSEPRLLGIAYAFEQATKRRVPPPFAQ